jgi:hypothetical protein
VLDRPASRPASRGLGQWGRLGRWVQHRVGKAERGVLRPISSEVRDTTDQHGNRDQQECAASDIRPSNPFPHVP